MAVSRGLKRLLRVRTIEEEISRQALESAMAEVRRIEQALDAATLRQRSGRRMVATSALSGDPADRIAGLEMERAGQRHQQALTPWREEAAEEAADRREEFLGKRAEMRQAETLVEEAEQRDRSEADRKAQLALDDWFSQRLHRESPEAAPHGIESRLAESQRPIWAEPAPENPVSPPSAKPGKS